MIPVVQLDPATLSLWLDVSLISGGPHGHKLSELTQRAAFGENNEVIEEIRALPDRKLASRAAHLVSCLWHEKRHFLDLLLTNYGALRVRHYFALYMNMSGILSRCTKGKSPLVCPLDVACDPFRLKMLDVGAVDPVLVQQAGRSEERRVGKEGRSRGSAE